MTKPDGSARVGSKAEDADEVNREEVKLKEDDELYDTLASELDEAKVVVAEPAELIAEEEPDEGFELDVGLMEIVADLVSTATSDGAERVTG